MQEADEQSEGKNSVRGAQEESWSARCGERGRERSCGLFSLDVCLFYVINVLRGRVCFQDPVQLI